MRPHLLVGIAGTATEIGKTWAAAAVAEELGRRGLAVAARKPVQSYDPDDGSRLDAQVLGEATGEDPVAVCPPHRTLPVAMAPPMAADVLGLPRPTLSELVGEVSWPDGIDVGLLETVGGVASPMAADGDSRAMLAACLVDVTVLVADAGLGTIDAVRTGLGHLSLDPVIVLLNRHDASDDLHRRNLAWLRDVDGIEACTSVGEVADRLARLLADRR